MNNIFEKNRYKQVGPTCGIYAFINAMIDRKRNLNKDKEVYKFACALWKRAIDFNCDLPKKEMKPENINYSIMGEFASSENLIGFLNKNKDFINQELSNFNCKNFCKANPDDNPNFNSSDKIYLVVVNGKEQPHCVCYKNLKIRNSNNNKLKRIKSVEDLNCENQKIQKKGTIDLKKAAKKRLGLCERHKWICEAKCRRVKIRKMHKCQYHYGEGMFPPILIQVEDKK